MHYNSAMDKSIEQLKKENESLQKFKQNLFEQMHLIDPLKGINHDYTTKYCNGFYDAKYGLTQLLRAMENQYDISIGKKKKNIQWKTYGLKANEK